MKNKALNKIYQRPADDILRCNLRDSPGMATRATGIWKIQYYHYRRWLHQTPFQDAFIYTSLAMINAE